MSRRQTYSQLRLRDPLPAPVPTAPEGVAAASRPSVSSLNSAAGAPTAPAAFLRQGRRGKPDRDILADLIERGLSDAQIGERFGHTDSWTGYWRRKLGLPPASPGQRPSHFERDAAETVALNARLAERFAAFHAEHGHFQSYSDAAIRRFEAQCAVARGEVGRLINITRQFFGDPVAGRGASVG